MNSIGMFPSCAARWAHCLQGRSHFTASLVGHQSARSENRLTYSIYSAGISDEQKRAIIDGIRLPVEVPPC